MALPQSKKVAFFSSWDSRKGWPALSDNLIQGLEAAGLAVYRFPLEGPDKKKLSETLNYDQINACDWAHFQYEGSFFSEGKNNYFQKVVSGIKVPVVATLHEVYAENPFIFPFFMVQSRFKFIKKIKQWRFWHRHPLALAEAKLYQNSFFSTFVTVHSEFQIPILEKLGVNKRKIKVIEHGVPSSPKINSKKSKKWSKASWQ